MAGNSGQAGVASEARAGPETFVLLLRKTLCPLFRGRPVLSLGDFGLLQSAWGCLGLVARVDWVGLYGHRGRWALTSSGFGDELQAACVVCNLKGWSQGDATRVSRVSEPGCRGAVLEGRGPGAPVTWPPTRDPPCA